MELTVLTLQYNYDCNRDTNVVLNGLENLDARRHVKRLCLAAGVSLVESGTTGYFRNIYMDIIEVSNLNKQFLFHKKHIGKLVLKFRPNMNIVAYHSNGKDPKFGVEFFKRFSVALQDDCRDSR